MSKIPELAPGTRIELIEMPNDPCPIEPGAQGTVESVTELGRGFDSAYQIDVTWDNGRSLFLVECDRYKVLS